MLQDNREIVLLAPPDTSDEINLSDAIRALAGQYKIFIILVALGVLATIIGLSMLPKKYLVETIIRTPTIEDLGDLNRQDLISVNIENALVRVVEELTSTKIQIEALKESELLSHYQKTSDDSPEQILETLKKGLTIQRAKFEYYELAKTEKNAAKNDQYFVSY